MGREEGQGCAEPEGREQRAQPGDVRNVPRGGRNLCFLKGQVGLSHLDATSVSAKGGGASGAPERMALKATP